MTREEMIDIVKCLAYHDVRPSEEEISAAIADMKAEPCEDAVSRQTVLEITAETGALETQARVKALPPVTPKPTECEDAVSRRDCLTALSHMMDTDGFRDGWAVSRANVECMLKSMPPVTMRDFRKESNVEQFVKWVATEIFNDMWEYNKDSFADIACRKLAKLGIVRANGDEWELVEPQESEDYNCMACAHDGDSNICLECENGSNYFKLRNL